MLPFFFIVIKLIMITQVTLFNYKQINYDIN